MVDIAVIEREVNGMSVRQRADGYVNATQLCKAAGKQIHDYLRLESTKEYLAEASVQMGIPISELVQVRKGGADADKGSWVHADVAINLAQWCSPKFGLMVARWIRELLTTGSVSVAPAEVALSQVLERMSSLEAKLASLGERRMVAPFPRQTIQDRIRFMGHHHLLERTAAAKSARKKIKRLANAMIDMQCEDWPDVSDVSGGGCTVYYGSMVKLVDDAIDAYVREQRRREGDNLFNTK